MRRPYYVDEWYSLIEDANERSPDRPERVAEMILQGPAERPQTTAQDEVLAADC
jgi:hypothetical protein